MYLLSPAERAVAIAEWSSYNTRLRQEQQQHAAQSSFRGASRSRGQWRGRGGRGGHYQPYHHQPYQRDYRSRVATFNSHDNTPSPSPIPTPPTANASTPTLFPNKEGETVSQPKTPCAAFTATGICKRNHCPHIHDPDKTAICKKFLFKESCPNGESCALSHEPNPHRSPHCIHFQNESCNKDGCHYAHVHVNAAASICEPFARLGYCEKGAKCADRHAFECPDFTNKGSCQTKGCRLPHVVHAGRLRKAAHASSSETESRQSSISLGPDDECFKPGNSTVPDDEHGLSQQADFIPLGP